MKQIILHIILIGLLIIGQMIASFINPEFTGIIMMIAVLGHILLAINFKE